VTDKPTPDQLRMYHDAAALDACLRRLGCETDQSRRVAAEVSAAINSGPIGERVAALGRIRRWAESKVQTRHET